MLLAISKFERSLLFVIKFLEAKERFYHREDFRRGKEIILGECNFFLSERRSGQKSCHGMDEKSNKNSHRS